MENKIHTDEAVLLNPSKTTNKGSAVSSLLFILIAALFVLFFAAPPASAQEDIIPDPSEDVSLADTEDPSDVENVVAAPGDGEATLTWDVATDNEGVSGYKIYWGTEPVIEAGDDYNMGFIDVGNKISHTVTDLINGTPYYFALTAYDEAANESVNYSLEVAATPIQSVSDSEAPQVVSAEAVNMNSVKVVFSEEVVLPSINAESAFSVISDLTSVPLEVTMAVKDNDDIAKATVILTTGDQALAESYIITVGIQVEDTSGNPIVSGTSDTAVFSGSDVELAAAAEEPEETDNTPPEITLVEAVDSTHISITFSEAVVLGTNPTESFLITEEENLANVLGVSDAVLSAEGNTVVLTTSPQQQMNYNLIVVDVADVSGNLISVESNATVFFGGIDGELPEEVPEETPEEVPSEADTSAPEDASDLMAQLVRDMVLRLNWTGSVNSAGDLANYVLYKSQDGKVYGDGIQLSPDALSHDVSGLLAEVNYYFKLTAIDTTGNESLGVVAAFKLPATGPELLFLLGGSFGIGRFLTRRKKKK